MILIVSSIWKFVKITVKKWYRKSRRRSSEISIKDTCKYTYHIEILSNTISRFIFHKYFTGIQDSISNTIYMKPNDISDDIA